MRILQLSLIAFLVAPIALADVLDEVNVFIGTAGNGHTSPAAAYPLGLVRPGPDTGNGDWAHCSGYRYDDPEIFGFSQTHVSGTGCLEFGDLRLFPFSGDWADGSGDWADGEFRSTYAKSSERAAPGEYAVTLDRGQIGVEITATPHVAFHRYTWPTNATDRRILIDLQWGLADQSEYDSRVRSCAVTNRADGLEGALAVKRWGERDVHFVLQFSPAPIAIEPLHPRTAREMAPRFVAHFGAGGGTVQAKAALSAFSRDGAHRNLAAEAPDWNLDRIRHAAQDAWRKRLSCMDVSGGTTAQRTVFRTALYHLFWQPNDIGDVGDAPWFSELSTWDTFRAAHPLYTLVAPDLVDDLVASLLRHYDRHGYLPVWNVWQSDTLCMIGNHAIPIAVDAYLKGFRGTDATRLMDSVNGTLRRDHAGKKLEDWHNLDRFGYYPTDLSGRMTAARTLEGSFDDWCAYRLANALGRDKDAAFYLARSRAYTNLFDSATGFMRGRDSHGSFREPFDPCLVKGWHDATDDYIEANAWQYLWHVLQAPEDLMRLLGGPDRLAAKLTQFFTLAPPDPTKCHDVSGFIGQYAHGNEPSHHVAYLFQFAGRGDLTAKYVTEICERFYTNAPDGLCGNEDCGQMSAWFLLSAAGFYPVTPCGGDYVLGRPQFPEVTIRTGDTAFRIRRTGAKVPLLNGKPLDGFILRHADIVRGGTLEM